MYIDTSVLGALFDEETQRVRATRRLLQLLRERRYEAFVGDTVIVEISGAPAHLRNQLLHVVEVLRPTIIEASVLSERLFEAYWATGSFRKGSRMDARHLALATVAGMDALVSWNYRDMVNLARKRLVQSVNMRHGYEVLDIVAPPEVPGVED